MQSTLSVISDRSTVARALTRAEAELANRLLQRVARGEGAIVLPEARALAGTAPSAPDALHILGLCMADAGLFADAVATLDAALRLAPGEQRIIANRARVLRRAGRLQEAVAGWREHLRYAPSDGASWTRLGLALLELCAAGSANLAAAGSGSSLRCEAIEALRRAVSISPESVSAWHALAQALRDEHRLPEAEQALASALELAPAQPALWISQAHLLRLRGQPEEALRAIERAEAIDGASPELLDSKVGVLVDGLRIDEAQALALQLVQRFPDYTPAYSTLAHLRWEYGSADEGSEAPEAFFRRAADARAGDAGLQLAFASFLLEAKRGEEAFERLQLLRQQGDHPRLLALQANALEIAGLSERAAVLYAEADPLLGAHDLAFNIAYVRHLLKTGQWTAAAARLDRTLALDPQRQETWAYLATTWRLLGDAREDWLCNFSRLAALIPVECPRGWSHMPEFLLDLRAYLETLHRAHREPVVQSLRRGSQTPGRLFGRPDPRLQALQQVLVAAIEDWLRSMPRDPTHPFLGRLARSIDFTGSWSVKLWQSGSHANHFHSDGWMSSAFYVSLPPSVLDQSNAVVTASESPLAQPTAGSLQLGQPPEELDLRLAPRRILRPLSGYLALFPSFMWHGTIPFTDPEPRITVAFDMLPRS